jgi:hypothetical protein
MQSHAATIQAILARELDDQLRQAHIVRTSLLTLPPCGTSTSPAAQAQASPRR